MNLDWRGVIKIGSVQHEAECKVGADTVELCVNPREQGDFVWFASIADEASREPYEGNVITLGSGRCDTLESAKLAAVEAWRRWAREMAEAAGFVVSEPGELTGDRFKRSGCGTVPPTKSLTKNPAGSSGIDRSPTDLTSSRTGDPCPRCPPPR